MNEIVVNAPAVPNVSIIYARHTGITSESYVIKSSLHLALYDTISCYPSFGVTFTTEITYSPHTNFFPSHEVVIP